MNGWVARGLSRRAAALGLGLRVLLGFGLCLETAPTPIQTWSPTQAPGPSAGSCPPTNFQCRSDGRCVPLIWRCDVDQDCLDGSDEEECGTEVPNVSPSPCDIMDDCLDRNKSLLNCGPQPCPKGELCCMLDGLCIPTTWLCDGHPDCSDYSDELGCGNKTHQEGRTVSMGTPATLENVTYLRNATVTTIEDWESVQSGNRSAYGIIAAVAVLSVSLAAGILFVLSRLCAQGCLDPLELLVFMKGSLQPERKTSVL